MFTKVKTPEEIENMRVSGKMLATVLQILAKAAKPGISTKDLADIAADELERLGAKSAFLGYQDFPDVLLTSVNDEVVHGIPRADCILRNGDIVGLDFGVNYKGMITDGAITVVVGTTGSQRTKELLRDTEESLLAGIEQVRNGVMVGDISAAIQKVLDKKGYGIVRELVGHGVGHDVHEEPNIPNYGRAGHGPVLKAGMTIAIEPMATLGGHAVTMDNDGWTIRTRDGSLAAHFEHTVLITEDGYEILTQV